MKITLKEEQQDILKLPQFIYKAIVNKSTSLGDNEALPPFGDFGFEYYVVKKGFEEADEIINNYIKDGELESKDVDYLVSVLSHKIEQCKKIEQTLKPQLEKLCENIVNSAFSIPSDTINIKCRLVGDVKPKNSIRVLPENDTDGNVYDFEDVDEVVLTNKVILKRRFINSLIQGISYWLSTDLDDWHDTVSEMNHDLWGLWYDIKYISDYLLYTKKDEINEKHPNLLSYVEVKLGKKGRKTNIDAQGIIFPYLLRDTFRGLLELFSSHGLPEDTRKAMYIIKKSDFLVAEPWDLRLGNGIVNILHESFAKYHVDLFFHPNEIPFFFSDLCKLETDEFNSVMKNFLLGTKKGNIIAQDMDYKIKHDIDYQKFKDRIQQKNIKTSVINDGDFSKEELDGYVLQENEIGEMMAYHGAGADFDKFNHKKYLNTGAGSQSFGWGTYVTNDKAVANGYVDYFVYENYDLWDDIYDGLIKNGISDDVAIYMSYLKDKLENFIRQNNNDTEIIKRYFRNVIEHPDAYRYDEDSIIEVKAMLYALEQDKRKKAYLYEVDIPDDNGFNYLSWYETLTNMQFVAIYNKMHDIEKRYNRGIFDNFDEYLKQFDNTKSGEAVYKSLEYCFYIYQTFETGSNANNSKAASLFLMQCGFDGIKYPAGTKWTLPDGASEDAYNYVIFDANKVKIVNKTMV